MPTAAVGLTERHTAAGRIIDNIANEENKQSVPPAQNPSVRSGIAEKNTEADSELGFLRPVTLPVVLLSVLIKGFFLCE